VAVFGWVNCLSRASGHTFARALPRDYSGMSLREVRLVEWIVENVLQSLRLAVVLSLGDYLRQAMLRSLPVEMS
jgi:hypothetical protein